MDDRDDKWQMAVVLLRAELARKALTAALRGYLIAKPQCQCTDNSGCELAAARASARAALAAHGEPE